MSLLGGLYATIMQTHFTVIVFNPPLTATVGQLPWSTSAIAYLCTPGVDMGAQREEPEGAQL